MITILLATFNGEKYIAEQIESILMQTVVNWKLVIQDDCSTDETVTIVKQYMKRNPSKINLIVRTRSSGSAKNNFSSMLKLVDTEYMMTCDQDDVWLPNKIEITMLKMKEMEVRVGKDTPLLVHSDLKVVDRNLKIISESMFQRQNLDFNRDKLNNLLVQNIVTGCTMMVNAALLNVVQEVPEQAIMHDWWMAIIASAYGKIGFVNTPTILYRQHSNNEIGSKNARSLHYNLRRMLAIKQAKSVLLDTYVQAKTFTEIYENQFTIPLLEIANAYINIPKHNKVKRLWIIQRYDFWKSGFFRKIGQMIFI